MNRNMVNVNEASLFVLPACLTVVIVVLLRLPRPEPLNTNVTVGAVVSSWVKECNAIHVQDILPSD